MREKKRGLLERFFGRRDKRRQAGPPRRSLRTERRLALEPLEQRALLSATLLPAITASVNPAAAGQSVTFTAAMPSNATGSLGLQVNGSDVSTSNHTINALEDPGAGGMTTELAMDPGTFPNMTINAWVDVTGWNDAGFLTNIVACFDGTDGGFYRGIGFVSPSGGSSEGQWQIQVGDECWSTGFSLSLDKWYDVSVVYSSTNITFYCNGLSASFGSPGTFGPASADMTVGFDAADGGPQYLDGYLNEVDVWKTALTSTEEAQVYGIRTPEARCPAVILRRSRQQVTGPRAKPLPSGFPPIFKRPKATAWAATG
jgi:hypothetical protein